jgi:hypothetical protein
MMLVDSLARNALFIDSHARMLCGHGRHEIEDIERNRGREKIDSKEHARKWDKLPMFRNGLLVDTVSREARRSPQP